MVNNNDKRTSFASKDSAKTSGTSPQKTPLADRRHRKVSPIGMRVLLRIKKEESVSEGGLYLPEGAKQNMDESIQGQVIEVASANDEDSNEEANISGIPLGATVLISKFAGIRLPWDHDLRLVETKEILALVEEVILD